MLPAGTVTEAGVVSAALLSESMISAPPPSGAALEIVTVHVLDPADARELGEQASDDTTVAVARDTKNGFEEVPSAAVTVAV